MSAAATPADGMGPLDRNVARALVGFYKLLIAGDVPADTAAKLTEAYLTGLLALIGTNTTAGASVLSSLISKG